MRALVVDDNAELASNVAELIETLGVAVDVVGDAERAIELAKTRDFDLAIVDVRLPNGVSGVDLVPRLRAVAPFVEIVIVTGNATVASAAAAVREGIVAYVQKPFDSNDLLAISRRALAQAALRREKERLTTELARSETLYRNLVETAFAAIVLLDSRNRVKLANRFAQDRAKPGAPIEGRSFLDAFVPDADRKSVARALSEARGSAGAREGIETVVHDETLGDRTMRWSFRSLDASLVEMVLAIGVDVSEIRSLQRRTVDAEALAAVGALTTGLAHEIRNPLNAASLQLELILRNARKLEDDAVRERIADRVDIVRGELGRLERMLNEFLTLARPRGLGLEPIDLASLVDAVIDLQRPVAEALGINLRSEIPPSTIRVEIDSAKIKQVLLNLIANAFDALRVVDGGSVVVDASPVEGGMIEVRVSDDGPGLEENPTTVLQPFVTTKEGGTGLGLAIAQRIVEHHGGRIALGRNTPRGVVARFTVPAAVN